MAKILNKMLNLVGWEIDEELEGSGESAEEQSKNIPYNEHKSYFNSSNEKKNGKVVNLRAATTMSVIVVQPTSFNESQQICDQLKCKKPVILNLENIEKEAAKRIFDFMLGAAYALDGSMMKISPNIFVFAPSNVDITDFCGE